MVSLRKLSTSSMCVVDTRVSAWQQLLKDFHKKREIKCMAELPEESKDVKEIKKFSTGTTYKGNWSNLGMEGYGEYTFSNGAVYKGEFHDGMMHGKGNLYYTSPSGQDIVIYGQWKNGVMTEKTLLFYDYLEYDEDNWKYCTSTDRRFAAEYENSLKPAGESMKTADQLDIKIPEGCYDTGDGFFDAETNVIRNYDNFSTVLRIPSLEEQKWIVANCRSSADSSLGPRPDLFKCWPSPTASLVPEPPPAAILNSKLLSKFRHESLSNLNFNYDTRPFFYDASMFEWSTPNISAKSDTGRKYGRVATE